MGLFLGVDDFVPAQCARLSKCFAADLALEWAGTRVHGHVPSQVVVGAERFGADLAPEWASAAGGADVSRQFSRFAFRFSIPV